MWRWNFEEFTGSFQEGLNSFKIWERFKIYFVPEFLTCNHKGIWSWDKKENCSLCVKISLRKVWWILDLGKIIVLNFKVWVSENHWNHEMKPGRPTALYSPTPILAWGHQAVYAMAHGRVSCTACAHVSAPTLRWHSWPPATSRRRCRPARHLLSTRRACSCHLLVRATPLFST
jgi:hypothetical protein